MEEATTNTVIPVTIQPKNVYGLRTDVIGNIHFTLKNEVIYPVEGVLAFHDYVAGKQKFLRFPENTDPSIIATSPNRKLLSIVEVYTFEDKRSSSIGVYDLSNLKKRRTITIPSENEDRIWEISAITFTADSKSLAVLTKPLEEMLFLFLFDKNDTILTARAGNANLRGEAQCIACNPYDTALISIGGDGVFKMLTKSEKGFTLAGSFKSDGIHITTVTWLSMEVCLAGTNDAKILLIENGELKARFDACSLEDIDLMKLSEEEGVATTQPEEPSSTADLQVLPGLEATPDTSVEISVPSLKGELPPDVREEIVSCAITFPKGFAFAVLNCAYVFERESKYGFQRKTVLKIPVGMFHENLYDITNIAVNQTQDTIIATAKHSQIYVGVLIVPESLSTKFLEFKVLGEPLHINEIIDISICSWRPIVMTASKDQTVRIWNYETQKIELVKKYEVDVTVIELNPNGLMAAVGFSDQLRIMEIFLDDLQIMKTYNFPRCRDVAFSSLGHLLAAAHDNLIAMTSVYNLETLRMLKGHNGEVVSVAWSYNDKYLISGGVDGAIYQWEVETGARIHEVVQKGIEYRCLTVTHSDPLSIYAVTAAGALREIANSEVVREFKAPTNAPLLSATLARSDLIMFMSTDEGHLYNVQLPFLDAGGGTCTNYRFFDCAVTRVKISYDGTLLVTTSKRGTLAIWVMKNIEGRIATIDQDLLSCAEVLIPRKVLIDKIDTIGNLELRMQQQIAEFEYQINQSAAFGEQQMANVHKAYIEALQELKDKNNELEASHVKELNLITSQINDLKENHQQALQALASQFSERMLVEYQKLSHLRENMIDMRETYEDKLRKSAGCLQDTIEALETDFKKQLNERQELIQSLMQEMEDKKVEFMEYCRQVELDNDRNMVESQLQYEKKLKNEQDTTLHWRGEAGVLKKKYDATVKETENLQEEIENLQEQHEKNKAEIRKLNVNIDELKQEIQERDFAIVDKEKRIQDVGVKNQELEKYKQVLSHKIAELKAQIEPRERQIKEKRNQIAEMERELEGLHHNNLQLELQLAEIKDKYLGAATELRTERQRARAARNHISRICGEIYQISGHIHKPELLKEDIKSLFQKYCTDAELKKSILHEEEVRNEFTRQRDYLEKMASICKKKDSKKEETTAVAKLMRENVFLLQELNIIRRKFNETKKAITNMESLLGIGSSAVSAKAAKQKLDKAVADYDKIQEKHQEEVKGLEQQINLLQQENQELRRQLVSERKQMEAANMEFDNKNIDKHW